MINKKKVKQVISLIQKENLRLEKRSFLQIVESDHTEEIYEDKELVVRVSDKHDKDVKLEGLKAIIKGL